jgi:hypothetical protein
LRIRHSYGSDSHIGFLVTDRRLDKGGSGTLLTGEGQVSLHQNTRLNWQLVGTYTDEPENSKLAGEMESLAGEMESLVNIGYVPITMGQAGYSSVFDGENYWGHALGIKLERQTRHTGLYLTYQELSPTYRPDNGFQTTNNYRNLNLSASYTFYPKDGLIERMKPFVNIGCKWNFDGKLKDQYGSLTFITKLRVAQVRLQTFLAYSSEWYYGVYYPGMWDMQQTIETTPGNLLHLGLRVSLSKNIARRLYIADKEARASFWARLKPSPRILINTQYNYMHGQDRQTGKTLFEGYVARTKLSYQLTRELSLRFVVQYNDFYETWDLDPLLTYRINPFSIIFLGSTFDYTQLDEQHGDNIETITRLSSRQFFVKFRYLFQL